MEAERNALHERVYPELREFCARPEHNARFQPIDLRWGVSQEASVDQQAMAICLGEIERCREVTPRPNFLVLLGNRYGWLPPPPKIPENELVRLREEVPKDKRYLLDWYRVDANDVPTAYRLRPRTDPPETAEAGDYEDYDVWGPVERELQAVLAAAADRIGLDVDRKRVYQASATEQEIREGALSRLVADDQAFCLFREITGPHPDPATAPDDDRIRTYMDADQGPLDELKRDLDDKLPEQAIVKYEVGWDGRRPTQDHVDRLVADALRLLKAAIENELRNPLRLAAPPDEAPRFHGDEHLDAEGREHRKFAEERARVFEGREDALGTVSAYLDGHEPQPFVVHGKGGTGKSAFMAEAIRRAQGRPGDLMYRFIGATPDSSSGRELLRSLCLELARRYEPDSEVPDEYQKLVADFRERLERAGAERPLCLFIDSLDQLGATDGARSLSWMPSPVPAGVRIVVSTRPGETLEPLERRGAPRVELGGLSREDGRAILRRWLGAAGRDLIPVQQDALLDAFESSDGNPLWLRLGFEEARRWRSDEPPEDLAAGEVEGIIGRNTFPRLRDEQHHGEVLVSRALGYLAASRYGLAEDELLDLLSSDLDVYRWFLRQTYHLPPDLLKAGARRHGDDVAAVRAWLVELKNDPGRRDELDAFLGEILPVRDGPRLPVVLWSRLFADLQPYLSERRAEGGHLIAFYHRELDEVAAREYLPGEEARGYHRRLADYFRREADPDGDRSWKGDSVRGLSELPYHLTQAAAGDDDAGWQAVTDTLTDFRFLERKVAEVGVVTAGGDGGDRATTYTGVFQLQDDYALALERMPGGGNGARGGRRRIIVTGTDFGDGLKLRCPHCNQASDFDEAWRGQEIDCPQCGGPLRVNEFVVERAR